MDDNPYQSPRESGYHLPEYDAWRRWLRDRLMLIVTAALIQAAILGSVFAYAWLGG